MDKVLYDDNPVAWQQNKSLEECNEYMLQNSIECDIVFRFLRESGHVTTSSAHKYMLMSRSGVFLHLLRNQYAKASVMTINDCDPEAFSVMLRYLDLSNVVPGVG